MTFSYKHAVAILACAVALPVSADEGLWLYGQVPAATLKQKHDFEIPAGFLDRLRLASVRIGGASGAFVSPNGLLVTNRQTAAGCLPTKEYLRDGFQAANNGAELRCPGLDASVLVKTEDMTAQVKSAGQSLAQRNAAVAAIEKKCAASTGNACSVIKFFAGGRYDLYQYRQYKDIRLVFAPEYSVAFFGKERDSFTYLRYGLNVAFLRAWEGGKPAPTPDYLKWSLEGVSDGDLVISSGNPRSTLRSATAAQLTFYRDSLLPVETGRLLTRIQALNTFASLNEESSRVAQPVLTPLLTAFKTDAGKLIGLRDDRLVARKTNFEQKIRRAVEADSKLGASAAKVWDDVAAAYKKWAPEEKAYQILEAAPAPGSRLFLLARQQVRGEQASASAEPVNDQIETLMLSQYLEELKTLGDKETPIKAILAGKTPKQAAEEMVRTKSVLRLAQTLEPMVQKLRKHHEETIGGLEVSAAEKIAQYRFKLFGDTDYPDGTATPRVQFGTVSGYTDRAAVAQTYASTFSGLYYRNNNEGPWQVPQNWLDIRASLNPVTPLDFVSTCDTGGGDYGSPVVNRAGELVGVTFDGNLESLPNVFLYSSEQARSVHVDVRGIAEALEKVYKADGLLRELGVRPAAGS